MIPEQVPQLPLQIVETRFYTAKVHTPEGDRVAMFVSTAQGTQAYFLELSAAKRVGESLIKLSSPLTVVGKLPSGLGEPPGRGGYI